MVDRLSRWLPDLEPPPGGELRLRHALANEHPQRPVLSWAVAGMVMVLVGSIWLIRAGSDISGSLHRELAAAMEPAPEVSVAGMQVTALPSRRPDIRLYLLVEVRPDGD